MMANILKKYFFLPLGELKTNRTRTTLTLTGIVIGVVSVVSLLSISSIIQKYIENELSAIGTNLVTVVPGKYKLEAGSVHSKSEQTLTMADVENLEEQLGDRVIGISASKSTIETIKYADVSIDAATIRGVYGNYWDNVNLQIKYGRAVNLEDHQEMNPVAVLGPEMAGALLGEDQPLASLIGQEIKIRSRSFTVIGITEEKGSVSVTSMDELSFIPMSLANKFITGEDNIDIIHLKTEHADEIPLTEVLVAQTLVATRGETDIGNPSFSVNNSGEFLQIFERITLILQILVFSIAVISLVIAGFGVMNIMLASVSERTREIGLYKALGAKDMDLKIQFLSESVIITTTGGLIGTILGLIVQITAVVLITTYTTANLTLELYPQHLLLALVITTIIGIMFGIVPANRAAKLSPVEALKHN